MHDDDADVNWFLTSDTFVNWVGGIQRSLGRETDGFKHSSRFSSGPVGNKRYIWKAR